MTKMKSIISLTFLQAMHNVRECTCYAMTTSTIYCTVVVLNVLQIYHFALLQQDFIQAGYSSVGQPDSLPHTVGKQ